MCCGEEFQEIKFVCVCVGYSDPDGYDILCTSSSGLDLSQNVPFFSRGPPNAGPMTVPKVLALGSKQQVSGAHMT